MHTQWITSVVLAMATPALGPHTEDGLSQYYWEKAAVVYAEVVEVDRIERLPAVDAWDSPGPRTVHTPLKLRVLASLAGNLDPATGEISVKNRVNWTYFDSVGELSIGDQILVLLEREIPLDNLDGPELKPFKDVKSYPLAIPFSYATFMPDQSPIIKVSGFEDAKVRATIDNLHRMRKIMFTDLDWNRWEIK